MAILKKTKKDDKATAEKKVAKKPAKKTAEKKADKKVAEKKTAKKLSVSAAKAGIVLRPVVTEKSARLASEGKYVFAVAKTANRVAIRQAIKELYGVMPTSVNVSTVRGKAVRRGKIRGKRSSWKKAIISVPSGSLLNVYEGV